VMVRCGEANPDSKRTKPAMMGGSDPEWTDSKHNSRNLVLSRHPQDGGVLVVE
jgi:hypothetical protein